MRGFLLFVFLVLVVPAVAVPGWVVAHRADLASPNDSDLALGLPRGDRDPTGYVAVRRAAELLAWPADAEAGVGAIRRGAAADPGWIAGLVTSNREAFQMLDGARAIDPAAAADEAELGRVHQALRKLVRLSGAAARASAARGDGASAISQAMLGMRLGRELTRGDAAGLTGMMLAEAYQALALEDLEAVVRAVELSPEATAELVRALDEARWRPTDWHRTWAAEYQAMKRVILAVDLQSELARAADGPELAAAAYEHLPPGYLWQPNRTLAAAADGYRDWQRRSAVACAPRRELPKRDGRLARVRDALRPNAIGHVLLDAATPSFRRYEEKRCHLEVRVSLVQTLAAMKAYTRKFGYGPKSLSVLVPHYLSEMPVDAFRDAPLQYSVDQRRVWSLGSDFETAAAVAPADPADPLEPAISVVF